MAQPKRSQKQRNDSKSTKKAVKLVVKGPEGVKSPRDFLEGLPKGSKIKINGKEYPKKK